MPYQDGDGDWRCSHCAYDTCDNTDEGRGVALDHERECSHLPLYEALREFGAQSAQIEAEDEEYEGPDGIGEVSSDDVENHKPPGSRLLVKALPGRPARMVSCEQELGRGGREVTQWLYQAGLAASSVVASYHCSEFPDAFCYVEDDGSLGEEGAEVIWQRMRLDRPKDAGLFETGLGLVGDAMSKGIVRLDSRCGFHIHVGVGFDQLADAKCYSMDAVESLYHLTNYLEDTLYRLASANWHAHRTEMIDANYAPPSRKGLKGKMQVGRWAEGARGAVNFSPFLGSRGDCSCGAFGFGAWDECTCRLHLPTVEFRVFNATSNPRKIRAYVALCLALVAYAEQNECTEDEYPAHPWEGTNRPAEIEPLRFILERLVLDADERDDLLYCVENCSLRGALETETVLEDLQRRSPAREPVAP